MELADGSFVEWCAMGSGIRLVSDEFRADHFFDSACQFCDCRFGKSSARDILTLRASEDGIILNLADNYVGSDLYHALIAFPPDDASNNAAIAVVPSGEISVGDAAGLMIATQRGIWCELEVTADLQPADWQATGSFIRGNGSRMTLFDPSQPEGTRFIESRRGRGRIREDAYTTTHAAEFVQAPRFLFDRESQMLNQGWIADDW
jgi:hypothetical protein